MVVYRLVTECTPRRLRALYLTGQKTTLDRRCVFPMGQETGLVFYSGQRPGSQAVTYTHGLDSVEGLQVLRLSLVLTHPSDPEGDSLLQPSSMPRAEWSRVACRSLFAAQSVYPHCFDTVRVESLRLSECAEV